ncbi:MAG: class I SAM-dependent RNA methyltransferase [Rhodospirillaceae bacterium]|nr:class I SAM-dependent RNA methyltransferase [Rhodospirillaceae bacterium]
MMEDLLIHDLGPKGDGVHRGPNGPLYVDRTLPGDRVEVRPRDGADGVARADLARVIEASPHRAAPPCPHYDVCGGCTLQHATAAFARDWKVDQVRRALAAKSLTPATWHQPVVLPAGTRRRVTFAAIKRGNAVMLGFHRRRSHQVAAIDACLVADPAIMAARANLAAGLVPILKQDKPAEVFIQRVGGQLDVTITGAVGPKGVPDLHVRESAVQLAQSAGLARLSWRLRDRDEPEVLLARVPVVATFGALAVPLPPLAFLQPTPEGEAALTAAVLAALPAKGRFADLFAGCGTFAGAMLAHGTVDAFEADAAAVQALVRARGSLPLDPQRRDLYRNSLRADEAARYDAAVFDPPRAGAEAQARALAASRVPVVVGVSCNPSTFARDARILVDGGYRLQAVTVIDQFAWSHHVELVASFAKSR